MPASKELLYDAIPQVARALREILTTTAAEAGRATRFVQRTSPLAGVYGWFTEGFNTADLQEATALLAELC